MSQFRVGAYIDGFNLYYGMRSHMGRSTPEWRWLDIRGMLQPYAQYWDPNASLTVVYCTARVNASSSQSAAIDQNFYLKALRASGSVDEIVLGHYVVRSNYAFMVDKLSRSRVPQLLSVTAQQFSRIMPRGPQNWPISLRNGHVGVDIQRIEEKGSDVNVASRLLRDMYENTIDAALVLTNDSDLSEPIRIARERIPVGVLNPHKGPIAGSLKPFRNAQNRIGSWNKALSLQPILKLTNCPMKSTEWSTENTCLRVSQQNGDMLEYLTTYAYQGIFTTVPTPIATGDGVFSCPIDRQTKANHRYGHVPYSGNRSMDIRPADFRWRIEHRFPDMHNSCADHRIEYPDSVKPKPRRPQRAIGAIPYIRR